MKRRQILIWLALTVVTSGAIACGTPAVVNTGGSHSSVDSESVSLTISVAASVQEAMKDIQVAYAEVEPAVTITYNFGSSGSLAQQIVQGAPIDVFLSASEKWMTDLETQGQVLMGSRKNLLQNEIVLIVAKNKIAISDFKDLGTETISKVAIGEPESVPAGQYAKEVLTTLNLFEGLQSHFVFGKDVRQVLSYVETGNVDAGLVYATDAQVSDGVQVVAAAPPQTHAPIIYPVAIVQDSDKVAAAQAFVDFLFSDTAIAIFQGYGFGMAE